MNFLSNTANIFFDRDVSGNQLNGSIPSGLLKKMQDGSLNLMYFSQLHFHLSNKHVAWRIYSGFLEDGTQVAVKLRSHSSNQGVKEFLAEVKFLLQQLMFQGSRDLRLKFDRLYSNICPGSDFDTDSSHESGHHDWLLHGWGVHGPCLRVYVPRNLARAYWRYASCLDREIHFDGKNILKC